MGTKATAVLAVMDKLEFGYDTVTGAKQKGGVHDDCRQQAHREKREISEVEMQLIGEKK